MEGLTNVLNYLKVEKVDIAKVRTLYVERSRTSSCTLCAQLTLTLPVEKVREKLTKIVDECLQRAYARQDTEGYILLERGFATIPLPGIDVPFHSRYLWAGVMPFRACK